MFESHHYLDGNLNKNAECYIGIYDNRIVSFCAVIQFPMKKGAKRIHRLVVLPECQGLGIGTKFNDAITKFYVDNNWEMYMITSNKGLARYLINNNHYKLNNKTLNKPIIKKKRNKKLNLFNEKDVQKQYNNAYKRYIYSFKTDKKIWYNKYS